MSDTRALVAQMSEAMRLADECGTGHPLAEDAQAAAAELRRQHAEIERLTAGRDALRAELSALREQEPVAEVVQYEDEDGDMRVATKWTIGMPPIGTKLYVGPAAAKQARLTDAQVLQFAGKTLYLHHRSAVDRLISAVLDLRNGSNA